METNIRRSVNDVYSVSSLTQQSASRHIAPLGRIMLIPRQPVSAVTP
jgi:hypothetical protein